MTAEDSVELLGATTRLASAYFSRNAVPTSEIPQIMTDIHTSLAGLGQTVPEPETLRPAVPIRKSVKDEEILCLECGKPMKMLKRHLATEHGLTIAEYKAKWGLARNYPTVAPAYARHRSEFAKKIGLGRKPGKPAVRGKRGKLPAAGAG